MNQEYLLPASPSTARQIVRLANISNTEISPTIRDFAATGLLGEKEFSTLSFNATSEEKRTIQQLVDYKHRAVVVVEQALLARRAILGSAILINAFPIVVATSQIGEWAMLARRLKLSVSENANDESAQMLVLSPNDLIDHEVICRRRHGLLILDTSTETERWDLVGSGQGSRHHGPAREFPRTVMICPVGRQLLPQVGWGSRAEQQVAGAVGTIFPTAPLNCINPPQAERARLGMFENLQQRGFTKYRPVDIYFMFNVITDLLKFKLPEEDYYPKDDLDEVGGMTIDVY